MINLPNSYGALTALQEFAYYKEADGIALIVCEISRLDRNTINVVIQPAKITPDHYDVIITAKRLTIDSYVEELCNRATTFIQQIRIQPTNAVALDGNLGLAYSEGVLVIEIPLVPSSQPKKLVLSANLRDME